MKWLLWREYRLSRLILIVGLVLLLLPYAIALIAVCWPWRPNAAGAPNVGAILVVAALYSVILSQLTLALLGGNAMAGERADRSAEFVAYLPVSRPRRLLSKLSLAAATAALLWGVNLSILLIPLPIMAEAQARAYNPIPSMLAYSAITGLTFFGVGWLLSSLQSSPTFAVCGGLISPMIIFMGLQTAVWVSVGPSSYRLVVTGYAVTCSVLAVTCFSIGTLYYLRRVEP